MGRGSHIPNPPLQPLVMTGTRYQARVPRDAGHGSDDECHDATTWDEGADQKACILKLIPGSWRLLSSLEPYLANG